MKRWRRELALPVTLVAIALGFLISLQVETHKNVSAIDTINKERLASMKTVLSNAQAENERLQKEHQELTDKLDQARKETANPVIVEQLALLGVMDGTRAVQGPGIQIMIDDRKQDRKIVFPLTSDDLLEIVNILRFAGAEAISINGQRIVGTTAIVPSGNATILINQVPIRRAEGIPYEINVIGNQDILADYFTNLKASGLKENAGMAVSVNKKTIQIPSFKGTYSFKYARPVIQE